MQAKRQRLADRPEIILDAADAVLRERGYGGLTIDAVAAAAKLSKGGVLHHYASKDALVHALVARKLKHLRQGIEASQAALPTGSNQLAQAMIMHAQSTYGSDDAFSRALLLASIENPSALDDYREFVVNYLNILDNIGSERGDGMVIYFSIFGLMMGRALGFHQLGKDRVSDMLNTLKNMISAPKPEY